MKRYAVAIIKGGLGNQLFSYAAARAFATRTGRELLVDDASGFAKDAYGRSFRLDQFPIKARLAAPEFQLGRRQKVIRAINKVLPSNWRNYIRELPGKGPEQLTQFETRRPLVYLNGYWQQEDYFKEIASQIREELNPPEPDAPEVREIEKHIRERNSVFVHLRRARYFPRLTSDYYQRSIQLAAGSIENVSFEVFGDDLPWAKSELDFGDLDVRYHSESPDELTDFRLMTACRHAIVANSSFSWWAAWLPEPEGRHVWTPANPGWPVKAVSGWIPVENDLETA